MEVAGGQGCAGDWRPARHWPGDRPPGESRRHRGDALAKRRDPAADISAYLHDPERKRRSQIRQIRIGKRRPGSASWRQEPLPTDARDPDIVHAPQFARRASCSRARPAQPDERPKPFRNHEGRT